MSVEQIKIKDLQPYHNNSRTHSKEQVEQVRRSIEEFGFTNPILIHGKTIIAGHCRLEAAKKLGMSSVPCLKLDHLSKDQARAYVIADNKLAMNAGWDDEVLKEEIESLIASDFEINLLGFDESELKDLGIGLPSFEGSGDGDPDDIPEVPQNIHGVKHGDIWMLGEHRLMCGDSTVDADVSRLMDGQKADMVFTDPPYGMSAVEKSSVLSARYKPIAGDDSTDVVKSVCRMILELNVPTVLWGANYYSSVLPDAACWLVWDKNNGQSDQMDCELAWTNLKGVVRQFTQASEKINRVHPTQKPVSLAEWCWNKYDAGSNILDIFLGSGSTLIACEKTGRKCFGMELDEHYCSVIIERWQQFTGKKAERIDERP